jgi:hypothetical protein
MKNKDTTDSIEDFRSEWRPSKGINWDWIQRMRFMNADAEIDPEDTFSPKFVNKRTKKTKNK